jgi:hypothetical protein
MLQLHSMRTQFDQLYMSDSGQRQLCTFHKIHITCLSAVLTYIIRKTATAVEGGVKSID